MKLHTSPSLFVVACWQQIAYMIYDFLNRDKLVVYKLFGFKMDIKSFFGLAKQVEKLKCI